MFYILLFYICYILGQEKFVLALFPATMTRTLFENVCRLSTNLCLSLFLSKIKTTKKTWLTKEIYFVFVLSRTFSK